MAFAFKRQPKLPEVILIETEPLQDDRGLFMEVYKKTAFAENGIDRDFVQENFSLSNKGVLRGLHYQSAPKAQAKLVRCLRGEILDVAVDVRDGSPTRGVWTSAVLSGKNRSQLYIPEGFAHGFYVLSEEAEVCYACTEEYSPMDEKGVLWSDPSIGIDWPDSSPLLSAKDRAYPPL